ncbi:MAG: hypothetical protein ACK5PW_19175 [Burkholderiales bacterium]|jgi:hypothetical protein
MTAARPQPTTAGERALAALETLLEAQRSAMSAGDLAAMQDAHAGIHGLLSNPAWRRDAALGPSQIRVRAALKAAAINAGLAARGEAHAARALAALGERPSLYTASGALGAKNGPSRGLSV